MKYLKQKVFGLYIGQHIRMSSGWPYFDSTDDLPLMPVEIRHANEDDCYLLVTPLSMITDEHAIEVARLFNECDKEISGIDLADADAQMVKEQINNIWMVTPIADFLRSNGYALPAFGHSIEELVAMGIFKLREV